MKSTSCKKYPVAKKELLEFKKLLLSELRLATFIEGIAKTADSQAMTMAVTANECLRSVGFQMKPPDIVRLAVSPSLEHFPQEFQELLPYVDAKPMYPDYPLQVMEMSRAEFRFHQCLHYWSTYGVELLTGLPVDKGWLPAVSETAKTRRDLPLFNERVIELVPEKEAPITALTRILKRRERMTLPQKRLVQIAVRLADPEELCGLRTAFKENLPILFSLVLGLDDRETALHILRSLCQHTGDVMKCTRYVLAENGYHLRTSQKKRLVRLIESCPVVDFRENAALSQKKKEQWIVVLQYLDYNQYSRSARHLQTVADLRSGKLRSWESRAKSKVTKHEEGALAFVAKRPGVMLRWIRFLIKQGYRPQEIEDALEGREALLSIQTLVTTIEKVGDLEFSLDELRESISEERNAVWYRIMNLESRAFYAELMSDQEYYPSRSENIIAGQLEKIRRSYIPLTETVQREEGRVALDVFLRDMINAYNHEEEERAYIEDRIQKLENQLLIEHRLNELALADRKYFWKMRLQDFRSQLRKTRMAYFKLDERTSGRVTDRKKAAAWDPQTGTVLMGLLERHFEKAETPLLGKKVYIDLDQFDLAKIRLECNSKSQEGGYLPSGIVFRIPEKARFVRFFVYWNDKERVDVDLHAHAHRTDGSTFHVGWNSDFRQDGIIYSGDITHSDSAEFIDIDLSADLSDVMTELMLYGGKADFSKVEECYVGMMAVKEIGREIRLYDPANCFFAHEIRMPVRAMKYGFIDVKERCVRFSGQPAGYYAPMYTDEKVLERLRRRPVLSLETYLSCVLKGQKTIILNSQENADVILTMEKSTDPRAISLADCNFFLDSGSGKPAAVG